MVTSKSLSRLEGLMTFYLRSVLPASLSVHWLQTDYLTFVCITLPFPLTARVTGNNPGQFYRRPSMDGCEYTMLLIAYQSHTQGEGGITPNPKAG